MSKKLKYLIGLFVLTFALSACGAEETGAADGQMVLNIWGDLDNQTVLESAFARLNEEFERQNPDIRVNFQFIGTLESINVAVQSNTLPDLFWVQGNKSTRMAEMARAGFLLPIPDVDTSRFPQDSIDYALVDGEFFSSLPSFFSYAVVYYNREIFSQFGLSAPGTWQDFIDIVDTLYYNNVTPIALGGAGDFDRYWFMQVIASALASDVLSDIENMDYTYGNIDFTNLEMIFNIYRDFAQSGFFGPNVSAIDGMGAILNFTNGGAAMIVDGTWNSSAYMDMPMEVGFFAMPNKEGVRFAQSGPNNMNTYAISANTPYPEAAIRYVHFLNSFEAQMIFAEEVGEIPMLADIHTDSPITRAMMEFDEIGLNIFHAFSAAATDTSRPQDILLTDILPRLMLGQLTGAEAIAELEREFALR